MRTSADGGDKDDNDDNDDNEDDEDDDDDDANGEESRKGGDSAQVHIQIRIHASHATHAS